MSDITITAASDAPRLGYSMREAAKLIGVSYTWFFTELVAKNRIRTIKIGGRRIVPATALEDFLSGGEPH